MISAITTSIGVTASFTGIHCWPDAPAHRAYLASPHRHKFGVKVEVSVAGHDREIEFHDLLDNVGRMLPSPSVLLQDGGNAYLNMSCEHHAKRILDLLSCTYPGRAISVTVDEDGECFATVTSRPA